MAFSSLSRQVASVAILFGSAGYAALAFSRLVSLVTESVFFPGATAGFTAAASVMNGINNVTASDARARRDLRRTGLDNMGRSPAHGHRARSGSGSLGHQTELNLNEV